MAFFEEEELESLENESTVISTVVTGIFGLLFLKEAVQFVVNMYYEGICRAIDRFMEKLSCLLPPHMIHRPDGNNANNERSESHASIIPPPSKSEILEHDENLESIQNLFLEKKEAEVCENLGEGCSSLLNEEEIDSDIDSDFVMVQNELKKMDLSVFAITDSDASISDSDGPETLPVEDYFGARMCRSSFVCMHRNNFVHCQLDRLFHERLAQKK